MLSQSPKRQSPVLQSVLRLLRFPPTAKSFTWALWAHWNFLLTNILG